MSEQRFLYCRDCNAVHHVTAFDTAPVFEIDGYIIREIRRDDRRDFMNVHLGHRIGELYSIGETRHEGGAVVDPMKVSYVEVTDGREFFIVRSFRRSITDPLSYEVLPNSCSFGNPLDESVKTAVRTLSALLDRQPAAEVRRYLTMILLLG